MDYVRYYIPAIVQLCAYAGFIIGGNAVFIGIASLPLLGLIDSVLSNDMKPRSMKVGLLADLPVWLSTFLAVGLYFMAASWIAREPNASGLQITGAILSLAWMSVVPLVASAHELYHQRGKIRRFVGRYSQVCYLDCTREIAHVTGHHLDVATPLDGDTAARGVSLYAFTGKAVIHSTRDAWRLESESLEKLGYGRWSIRHRLWRAILAQLVMQSIVYAIAGWAGVALVLAGMVGARFWVESFNYFQHYGLIRLPGGAISRRHVWNHLKPLSRIMGFEITNHADHHTDSFAQFHQLRPDRQWIPMPSVFVCFFSALIPPLWHNAIIKPALKRWDNEMATPEERELAKAQNKAAGWPDWFDETPAAGNMAAA
jgi:p-cymene methyl-monooxygenase